MYYSIFDGQDYLYTGLNSETRRECIEDGIDFVFEDSEEKETIKKSSIGTKEVFLNNAGYEIHSHEEPIEKDVYYFECANCKKTISEKCKCLN